MPNLKTLKKGGLNASPFQMFSKKFSKQKTVLVDYAQGMDYNYNTYMNQERENDMKKLLIVLCLIILTLAGCSTDKNIENDSESDIVTKVVTLADLTESQIELFRETSLMFNEDVIAGTMSMDELDAYQDKLMEDYLAMGEDLPENAVDLFRAWKASVGFYSDLAEKMVAEEKRRFEEMEQAQQETVVTPQQNKPQPSESQQQTQVEDVQSKPLNPSQNIEEEGEYYEHGSTTNAVEAHGDGYDEALASEANRIAKQQGISFEEAVAQVEKAWGY